jgi:GGDEF domain-containing protein
MAGFDLRELEFQSDGVTDSLTSSMAPALFHENLKREVATAGREGRELTLVSITVQPDNFLSCGEFQESLIALAFHLEKGLRGGDFFARISDCGFWILLRTDEEKAKGVIDRLDLPRRNELSIKLAARKLSDYAQWITRVDQLHFN